VSVKKLNANEPLMICRKDTLLTKLSDLCTDRKTVTGNCLLVTGQPALRRQELYTGFYTKRGKLLVDAQKALQDFVDKTRGNRQKADCLHCNTIPSRWEKQQTVTDEVVVVMIFCENRKERRTSVNQLKVFWNNPNKELGEDEERK
jgi:hypothetical protein